MILRGAVDAGRHGAARPAGRDAPERERAEGVGSRAGLRRVVGVVAVLVQEFREAGVIRAAVFLEQGRADPRDLDLEERVFVTEAFAAGAVVRAEPGVDLDRCAVDVERCHVRRHGAGVRAAHAVVDAVERRSQVVLAQELLVREHRLGGELAGRAEVQGADAFILERDDAFARTELRDDLGVVAGQAAFPAKRVDTVGEPRGPQFLEAPDAAHARLAVAAHFSAKRLANSLASAS